jgi:hypothetical protein
VSAAANLVDQAASVVVSARHADEDRSHTLVADELKTAAKALAGAANAVASPSREGEPQRGVQLARQSLADLDSAFAGVRDRRATYATEDVTRLLSVIRSLHVAAAALYDLAD